MNSIFFKLIGAHFLVTVITIIVMSFAMNNETYFLVTLFSCILYFYTGYKVTKTKSNWINYFGTCIIGLILWFICITLSSNSTNYNNSEAGFWFIYKLYVSVSSPINFIDSLNEPYNLRRELLVLFFIPILASIFQFIGGKFKIWEIKYNQKEKL